MADDQRKDKPGSKSNTIVIDGDRATIARRNPDGTYTKVESFNDWIARQMRVNTPFRVTPKKRGEVDGGE